MFLFIYSNFYFRKFTDNLVKVNINSNKGLPPIYLENVYERVLHTGLLATLPEITTKSTFDYFCFIVKSGWMSKQGMDLLKMWKKRWFILTNDKQLHYYRKPAVRLKCVLLNI